MDDPQVFVPDFNQNLMEASISELESLVGNIRFELPKKYENLSLNNHGILSSEPGTNLYGIVCHAWDKESKRKVEIKRFDIEDNLLLLWCLIREVEFFRKTHEVFRQWFNELKEVLIPTPHKSYAKEEDQIKHIYLIYHMDMDALNLGVFIYLSQLGMRQQDYYNFLQSATFLPSFIPKQESRGDLKLTHDQFCRELLTELLLLLKYFKARGIVHRNINPLNVYLSAYINTEFRGKWLKFDIQISSCGGSTSKYREVIDDNPFGGLEEELDRITLNHENQNENKDICYRAPEILLGQSFEYPSDMWSVGCLFAEILGHENILFTTDGGDDEGFIQRNQLDMITLIRGDPTLEEIADYQGNETLGWFRSVVEWRIDNQLIRVRQSLYDIIPNANAFALDLLEKMLDFNPRNRITVEDALNHPYVLVLLDTNVHLKHKFNAIERFRVAEEGNIKERMDEGSEAINDEELCRKIFLREKFMLNNPEGILKGRLERLDI